ncbi:MAG: hypothetical protein U5K43_08225 [Halofilum sp. (in: g-proteobacteria)]|nr:hypothetical protein [Halofilum sp. (in: g-proteobacteria)]
MDPTATRHRRAAAANDPADPPDVRPESPQSATEPAAAPQVQSLARALAEADAGPDRRHYARRLARWQLALAELDADGAPLARRRVPWGNPFAR